MIKRLHVVGKKMAYSHMYAFDTVLENDANHTKKEKDVLDPSVFDLSNAIMKAKIKTMQNTNLTSLNFLLLITIIISNLFTIFFDLPQVPITTTINIFIISS